MFFSCFIGELRLIQEITSVISVIIAILLSLYIIRQTKRTAALIPSLSDFIQRGEDGETVMREDLALVIDAFGQRMAQGIKMSFLQGLGAQAKIEKGLKSAMAQDILENKMPLFNMIADYAGFKIVESGKKNSFELNCGDDYPEKNMQEEAEKNE